MRRLTFFLLVMVFAAGCEDMLDVEPESFTSPPEFYQTEDQIEQAVTGAYGELQTIYDPTTDFWAMTEMRSDNTSYQFNVSDRGEQQMEELDEFLITPSNNDIEAVWSNIYSGILQTNMVLGRIGEVEFEDEAREEQFRGEMHFLRAFHYFHLVRLYGGVPLVLEELETTDEAFSEKASVEEVYTQIVKDVNSATELLPERYSSGSDIGRATKGAALTLLGEVHMTRGAFGEAITALEEVTRLDYELLDSYEEVFDPASKNHAESIFDVQFSAGIEDEESRFIYRFAPFNSGEDIIGFSDLSTSEAGYNIPTHDMVDAYEEGDARKEASIAFYVNAENSQFNVSIGDSIPFINKYNHDFEERGRTDENWPVYRYSHVLLMLAEALNEEGRAPEAHNYLNQVRERAGLSPVSNLSQSAFRDAVYHEQRVELAFENHRWFNLLRTGQALETMSQHGEEEKEYKARLSGAAYELQEYMLLYPIPEREVRLNDIEQNPGW
ncbi:MAG TPA: RagB/SusD family nutrient uptake outer membrane protein [Fodinibius sp.]|nr:RagB/SusD family nutrient uptake outer membrane protein [Fodinibius sp.]